MRGAYALSDKQPDRCSSGNYHAVLTRHDRYWPEVWLAMAFRPFERDEAHNPAHLALLPATQRDPGAMSPQKWPLSSIIE